MRVLLQHTKTRLYLISRDAWTPDRNAAHDFHTCGAAILFTIDERLSSLQIVLAFDDPRFDMTLPTAAKQPPDLRF